MLVAFCRYRFQTLSSSFNGDRQKAIATPLLSRGRFCNQPYADRTRQSGWSFAGDAFSIDGSHQRIDGDGSGVGSILQHVPE